MNHFFSGQSLPEQGFVRPNSDNRSPVATLGRALLRMSPFALFCLVVTGTAAIANPDRMTTASSLLAKPEDLRTIPYTVRDSDSVAELAERFDISEQLIRDVNDDPEDLGDVDLEDLEEGDLVELPWMPTVLNHEDFSTESQPTTLARLDGLPQLGDISESGFIWPVQGNLSSGFGWRGSRIHAGIDIVGPTGTQIVAAASGRIIFAGWYYGYGYMVDIEHDNGTVTRYAHASRLLVAAGQEVAQGEAVMLRGSTGRSTTPHLHFEIRVNGRAVNPVPYLSGSQPPVPQAANITR